MVQYRKYLAIKLFKVKKVKMKRSLIYIAIALFTQAIAKAQIPQENEYRTNNFINKFQGTWKWASGADSVIIKIGKVRYFYKSPENFSSDRLLGCHVYYKNAVIIENSLDRFDSVILYAPKRNTLYLWNSEIDTSKIEGVFSDISKHKIGHLILTFIYGVTPQLIWFLKNEPGLVAVIDGEVYEQGFTLPENMVFIKQ